MSAQSRAEHAKEHRGRGDAKGGKGLTRHRDKSRVLTSFTGRLPYTSIYQCVQLIHMAIGGISGWNRDYGCLYQASASKVSLSILHQYLTSMACSKTLYFWPCSGIMLSYKTEYIFFLTQYGLLCVLGERVNSSELAEEVHTCNPTGFILRQGGFEFEASLHCIEMPRPSTLAQSVQNGTISIFE